MIHVKRYPHWRKEITSRKIHMYSIDSIILENSMECDGFGIKWESGKLASENSVPYLNVFLPKFSKTKWEF